MGKKYDVRYLPASQKDVTDIVDYIKQDNPSAAIKLIDEITEVISHLEDFPSIGSMPKDLRLQSLNYKILVIDNYLVFYTIKEEDNIVEIRRILHGKRRYSFLF
ncbi:MAG TPA: type II toxin-antitoxin system RelE/ParE family toxin [Bacillota bacterium]